MATLKVLMAAAELAEVASVGGLGEYLYGLAFALAREGHDVRVALPAYRFVRDLADKATAKKGVALGQSSLRRVGDDEWCLVRRGRPGHKIGLWLCGDHAHFGGIRSPQFVYETWAPHPWVNFSRRVFERLAKTRKWRPDVIHCHDAHTSIIPVLLADLRARQPRHPLGESATVLTIHNLVDQGWGERDIVEYAGLPPHWYGPEGLEFFGGVNCLKGGLLWADMASAVSETYAEEICRSGDYGFRLEGVLDHLRRQRRLTGIINGIDEQRWRMKGVSYKSPPSLDEVQEAKRAARAPLYESWGWPDDSAPLISFRARWDRQKGVETLVQALEAEAVLEHARFVIASWSVPAAEQDKESHRLFGRLKALAETHPGRVLVDPEGLAGPEDTALHYLISDFLLMPSRYEPCGLAQMEAQRYGCVPIVRRTGGLADTVSDVPVFRLPSPNGIMLDELNPRELIGAIRQAFDTFRRPAMMAELVRNCLLQSNGWNTRVAAYESLYRAACLRAATARPTQDR